MSLNLLVAGLLIILLAGLCAVILNIILAVHFNAILRLWAFFSWEQRKLGQEEKKLARNNLVAALGLMLFVDLLATFLIFYLS